MKTREFYFDLPDNLIAQYPQERREDARLMVLDPKNQKIYHESNIKAILKYIDTNTLLVFNNSRVRKSRLFALSKQGLNVEFLILKRESEKIFSSLMSKSKKYKVGDIFTFKDNVKCQIISKEDNKVLIEFNEDIKEDFFENNGFIPLPPYIKREYLKSDEERYQTVYSKILGSSASPTAGLHFPSDFFSLLDERKIDYTFVTLHVGLGTFLPVRSENIEEHKMHFEDYFISSTAREKIEHALREGRKILAIGTTSLRVLESALVNGKIHEGEGRTNLFIYPGYKFKVVDMLFSNFHTPESTLLMLVSSFAGKDFILKAYREAVSCHYRFFSYGDALLILERLK